MKKLILLLIIPFLLPDHLSAQTVLDYYPMQLGNYWISHTDTIYGVYQPTTFRIDVEAVDLIGGDEYFRIRQEYSADDGSSKNHWYNWFRKDSTGGVTGAFGDTSIVALATIFDPPLPAFPNESLNQGYSWEYDSPGMGPYNSHWYCFVESISETVEVPAGDFNNCINIKTIITDAAGDTAQWMYNYYAEGIGQVLQVGWSLFWENFKFELVEYSVQSPVEVKESPSVPLRFRVQQNYPNPFNPITKIKYSVPQSSNVVIKVFDILGNEIETLINEEKNTGTYEITWYVDNLPSGVYFYQLKAGDFVETKKMVLLR